MRKLKVLIVSRTREVAEVLAGHLSGSREYIAETRIMTNGHADPLHDINELPDVLLLHCLNGQAELQFLADNGIHDQLALIVCGPANDMEIMRLGMQAGARDYLPENMPGNDLIASLARIKEDASRSNGTETGKLIAIANGKGGSGASFIATNLAHGLLEGGKRNVLLADLDLQFGGLYRYLDIAPKVGLIEALEAVSEMDEVSADAYTTEHVSGLKLIAAQANQTRLPRHISIDRLESLLQMYLSLNDFMVADVPSRLDPVTELAFERADQIVIVVQQFLPNVQDAARLMQLLNSELGIPRERIIVAINRYSKNAPIEVADIQKALRVVKMVAIPNQFKLAAESINTGVPVADLSKNGPLTKGLRNLQASLTDTDDSVDPGLLKRALPSFLRR